jgi:hypothetical protein
MVMCVVTYGGECDGAVDCPSGVEPPLHLEGVGRLGVRDGGRQVTLQTQANKRRTEKKGKHGQKQCTGGQARRWNGLGEEKGVWPFSG